MGRSRMDAGKKVKGTRNEYRQVEQENYLVVDGIYEPIVSE